MPTHAQGPTIFVVDDDEGLLVLIENALRAEHWRVATATSGTAALAWLEKNSADLLLLDLRLSDIKGRKFISAMAQAGRVVPFIVITGQGDERVAVEMMKSGALDYLVKDIDFVEFLPTVVRRALQHIAERRQLQREILEISEREQRKFGHDLHDDIGQRLTGLEMFSHALAEDLKGHAPRLLRQARRLNRGLRETITQARLISHGLAPVPFAGDGLRQGLRELAESTNRIPGVVCRFFGAAPVSIDDVATATHLYRIAQEAVNNALKHGPARKIDIRLSERSADVELTVQNNGRPFPATRPEADGMGLHVMRYRADMIGAILAIEPGKPNGVLVRCTFRRMSVSGNPPRG